MPKKTEKTQLRQIWPPKLETIAQNNLKLTGSTLSITCATPVHRRDPTGLPKAHLEPQGGRRRDCDDHHERIPERHPRRDDHHGETLHPLKRLQRRLRNQSFLEKRREPTTPIHPITTINKTSCNSDRRNNGGTWPRIKN